MEVKWLLSFCISVLHTVMVDSYKMLLIPALFKSHLNYFVPVGSALTSAGHEVYIILADAYPVPSGLKEAGVHILTYESPGGVCYVATEQFALGVITTTLKYPGDPNKLGQVVAPHMAQECENLLSDEKLYNTTKNIGFDVALVDGLFFSRCLYLLPARLGITYATLTTFQEPWHLRNPALPSFVPFHYAPMTDRMSLFERLFNTFVNFMWIMTCDSNVPPLSEKAKANYPRDLVDNYKNLIKRSSLWFYNTDLILDYPKPAMPNSVNVGGMSVKQTQPLPANVQRFMDNAKHGVVVVSFGSVLPDLPGHLNEVFLEAFKRIPQRVLWRISKKVKLDYPENVMAMTWLPQQDVLAHPNTKLLITHCGNNGQFEAVYYQIPMIGFPILADQHFNSRRIEYKGYGTYMDIHNFDSNDLVNTINKIISNSSYSENLERASGIFKDRPDNPRQRVVYWMEHLVKYGGDHLRTPAMDMPWYSYLLIDVFILATLIIFTFLLIIAVGLYFLIKFIRKQYSGTAKQKES